MAAVLQFSRSRLRVAWLLTVLAGVTSQAASDAPPREAGQPFVQTFDRRDYRGHAQVAAIAADAQGILYFGNYAQVLVYDGVQWDRIPIPGATFVRSLAVDRQQRLWVGAAGALGYIDIASPAPAFTSLASQLPSAIEALDEIQRVHLVSDTVFFRSLSWLLRWRGGKFDAWPLSGPAPWQSFLLNGELTLQNPAQGWRRVGPHGPEPFEQRLPGGPPVRVALPRPDGRTLIGSLRIGFSTLKDGKFTPIASDATEYFSSHILFSGTVLSDGRYAFASLNGGAAVFRDDLSLETLVDESSGLPTSTVHAVLPDAHGGLWLGLDDGIARLDDTSGCTWFPVPSPLGRISYFALERCSGRLFLGSDRTLARLAPPKDRFGPATWEPVGYNLPVVTALAAAEDTLLLATQEGCFARQGDKIGPRLGPLMACHAIVVSRAQPGRAFVGHRRGLALLRRTGATWSADGTLPGLDAELIQLLEETDGTLWAATPSGTVWRITFAPDAAPVIESFDSAAGLLETKTPARLALAAGRPVFLTARGLQRFDPAQKKFVPEPRYGARFADGSTQVMALAEDERGGVWIAPRLGGDTDTWSDSTLGRVLPDGTWETLSVPDLARIGDVKGLRLETTDGREVLWVVGVSGILRVDLRATRPRPTLGRTLIREAVALDSDTTAASLAGIAAPALPYAQNSLRFRFAAPGLAAQPDVKFETELVGLGNGVRRLGTAASREFTSLPEGRYVFRARARGINGHWTAPGEFAFSVLPPWWRTSWAYALWGALGGGAVISVVTLRTRALRRQNARLEAVVTERTRELAQRNVELARLHQLELDEKISAQLAEEKVRLEMLRYQLNPHFLFNTLNSLYGLVAEHPTASHMVLGLSEFCRLTLTRGADQLQTLGDELTMLDAYLRIEQVRWGDSLRTTITADEAARAQRLPAFLLLPLVENAIKHGGETSPGLLEVSITARLTGKATLQIDIVNTGTWLAPGTARSPSTGIGLENLRERLRRHYPSSHFFTTGSHDGRVVVRLVLAPPGTL